MICLLPLYTKINKIDYRKITTRLIFGNNAEFQRFILIILHKFRYNNDTPKDKYESFLYRLK